MKRRGFLGAVLAAAAALLVACGGGPEPLDGRSSTNPVNCPASAVCQ